MGRQLYLDLDGVLADFDGGAEAVFGMAAKDFQDLYGPGRFWGRLAKTPDFYDKLEVLPDAMELFEAVRQLRPIILTGLPIGKWAEPQKRRWVERHFPGVQVITTLARKKSEHCRPGDVLVDDQEKYRDLWEQAGGTFIHHAGVASSIAALKKAGLI